MKTSSRFDQALRLNLNGEQDAPALDSLGRKKYDLLVITFHIQYAWIPNSVV